MAIDMQLCSSVSLSEPERGTPEQSRPYWSFPSSSSLPRHDNVGGQIFQLKGTETQTYNSGPESVTRGAADICEGPPGVPGKMNVSDLHRTQWRSFLCYKLLFNKSTSKIFYCCFLGFFSIPVEEYVFLHGLHNPVPHVKPCTPLSTLRIHFYDDMHFS